MHVILARSRHLIVNHVLHIRNVQAASGHIGGDQQARLAGREALQILQALPLVHVRMQRPRLALQQREQLAEPLHAIDRVAEDDRAARMALQKVVQVPVLLRQLADDATLGEALRGAGALRDVDDLRLRDAQLLDERVDLLGGRLLRLLLLLALDVGGQVVDQRQRGGENEVLALCHAVGVGVQLGDEELELLEVALLHHAIGFVDDQIADQQRDRERERVDTDRF